MGKSLRLLAPLRTPPYNEHYQQCTSTTGLSGGGYPSVMRLPTLLIGAVATAAAVWARPSSVVSCLHRRMGYLQVPGPQLQTQRLRPDDIACTCPYVTPTIARAARPLSVVMCRF